ncbi:MAG: hypothetical protein RL367_263 [Pseudomonadota bacterium]
MTQTRKASFPLRLPLSLRTRIEKLAAADGVSLNQFIAMTLAEKLGASREREFFADYRQRSDVDDLMSALNRKGGQPPVPGDEMPG